MWLTHQSQSCSPYEYMYSVFSDAKNIFPRSALIMTINQVYWLWRYTIKSDEMYLTQSAYCQISEFSLIFLFFLIFFFKYVYRLLVRFVHPVRAQWEWEKITRQSVANKYAIYFMCLASTWNVNGNDM